MQLGNNLFHYLLPQNLRLLFKNQDQPPSHLTVHQAIFTQPSPHLYFLQMIGQHFILAFNFTGFLVLKTLDYLKLNVRIYIVFNIRIALKGTLGHYAEYLHIFCYFSV